MKYILIDSYDGEIIGILTTNESKEKLEKLIKETYELRQEEEYEYYSDFDILEMLLDKNNIEYEFEDANRLYF